MRALPTMMATPQSATALASRVRRWGISFSHIQASAGREEGAGRYDDRDIGHAGELQRGDEGDHRQRRQRRDQPAVDVHLGQIPQAGTALQKHHRTMIMNPANSRARTGWSRVVGEQPREERRGAPEDGGGDDKGDAETMLGTRLGHLMHHAETRSKSSAEQLADEIRGIVGDGIAAPGHVLVGARDNEFVAPGGWTSPAATSTTANGTPLAVIASATAQSQHPDRSAAACSPVLARHRPAVRRPVLRAEAGSPASGRREVRHREARLFVAVIGDDRRAVVEIAEVEAGAAILLDVEIVGGLPDLLRARRRPPVPAARSPSGTARRWLNIASACPSRSATPAR